MPSASSLPIDWRPDFRLDGPHTNGVGGLNPSTWASPPPGTSTFGEFFLSLQISGATKERKLKLGEAGASIDRLEHFHNQLNHWGFPKA